jgi:hypothetical protein
MTTSFSGGRSRSTRREPPTMDKQLVNFITCGCESQSSAPFFVIYKARRKPRGTRWLRLQIKGFQNKNKSIVSTLSFTHDPTSILASVYTTWQSTFVFRSSSPCAIHLKFIHKIRDHEVQAKSYFGWYQSGVMCLDLPNKIFHHFCSTTQVYGINHIVLRYYHFYTFEQMKYVYAKTQVNFKFSYFSFYDSRVRLLNWQITNSWVLCFNFVFLGQMFWDFYAILLQQYTSKILIG